MSDATADKPETEEEAAARRARVIAVPKAEPYPAPESAPTEGMAAFKSNKRVLAGEITEVTVAGCYVKNADGEAVFRAFEPNMTARYAPVPGDWWIVYEDGYQALSPRDAFVKGYEPAAE